jgi:hypothetical protein
MCGVWIDDCMVQIYAVTVVLLSAREGQSITTITDRLNLTRIAPLLSAAPDNEDDDPSPFAPAAPDSGRLRREGSSALREVDPLTAAFAVAGSGMGPGVYQQQQQQQPLEAASFHGFDNGPSAQVVPFPGSLLGNTPRRSMTECGRGLAAAGSPGATSKGQRAAAAVAGSQHPSRRMSTGERDRGRLELLLLMCCSSPDRFPAVLSIC